MAVNGVILPAVPGAPAKDVLLPEGATIAEYLGDVVDYPGLRIFIGEHEILRPYWHVVRPRRGTRLTALVPVHGGGGGGKGKNVFAVVGSLVVAAAAIAASGGAFAPLLGTAFGPKTLGASILGAAIGVLGSLAVAVLFPAPTLKGPKRPEAGENFQGASISGNPLEPGAPIPRIVGQLLVPPPLGAAPVTRLIDHKEEIRAFFVLAGPHRIDEVRINGADVASVQGVETEVLEGWDDDPSLTLIQEQNHVSPVSQELSEFVMEGNPQQPTYILNQSEPTRSSPNWHRFVSRRDPDQIDLRLQIFALQNAQNATERVGVAYRFRIRKRGDTAWRNLPEFWFAGTIPSVAAREVRLKWQTPPTDTEPNFDGTTKDARFVGYKTSVPNSILPVPSGNSGWTADPYFSQENVRRDEDGATMFLDEAEWPKGIYEIEVIRSMQFRFTKWDFATYTDNSPPFGGPGVRALFEPENFNGIWRTEANIVGTASDKSIISDVITRWYEPPMNGRGLAVIAIKSEGVSIRQVTVLAGGYVKDWDGRDWKDWRITSNPAPHYRDVLVGAQNFRPLPVEHLDNDTLVAWRAECAARSYRCDAFVGSESVAQTASLIAGCGFAVPRQADTWAVAYERDRTGDTPRQVFTPQNSANYSFVKAFEVQPAAIKSRIFDREEDWKEREILTSNEEPVQKRVETEGIDYEGLTSEADVQRRARFDMGQITKRGVQHIIEVPVEYLNARKGDLVGFESDVLSKHLEVREVAGISGADITLNDGFDYFSEVDVLSHPDILAVEDFLTLGETSYCAVVNASGVSVRQITAWDSGTKTATLATAPDSVAVGDRFVIGVGAKVYRRMLIQGIEPIANLRARLILVDEAPELVADLIGS